MFSRMPPSEDVALWRASAESFLKFSHDTWWILPCIMGKFEKKMLGVWKSQMPVGALALILEMSHLFSAEEKAYLVMCPADYQKFSACALWQ
jgi:hypothetical protein